MKYWQIGTHKIKRQAKTFKIEIYPHRKVNTGITGYHTLIVTNIYHIEKDGFMRIASFDTMGLPPDRAIWGAIDSYLKLK